MQNQYFQCPKCGISNYIGEQYCRNCRQSFVYTFNQQTPFNNVPQYCKYCGINIQYESRFCSNCGNTIFESNGASTNPSYFQAPIYTQTGAGVYQNTSGQGDKTQVPEEIKGWSWGGFLLGWTWGIFNNVWISLLELIPALNLIIWILLGIYGNEWAWKNKKWDSIASFKNTQKKWSLAGVCVLGIVIVVPILAMIISIAGAFGSASSAFNSVSSFMDNINSLTNTSK